MQVMLNISSINTASHERRREVKSMIRETHTVAGGMPSLGKTSAAKNVQISLSFQSSAISLDRFKLEASKEDRLNESHGPTDTKLTFLIHLSKFIRFLFVGQVGVEPRSSSTERRRNVTRDQLIRMRLEESYLFAARFSLQ